ncbi:MAG: tetratricopeptide repeat protein [Pirellulales bacterium]|nr:tetratricopeptide repeat protein [Pirellulales bacterium]
MKSERRHELQHNALADWLVKIGTALKPYQNLIFVAAILLLAAFAVHAWWSRTAEAEAGKAWTKLFDGMGNNNVTKLADVIDDYPNTTVSHAAAVLSGDYRLSDGCYTLFQNKERGKQRLDMAIIHYETDRREGGDAMLLARATFGLARAKEAKGELEEAEKYYREVADKWPDGAFCAAAKKRLEELKRPEIRQLYRDLDDPNLFDPQPEFSHEFEVPGRKPGFDMKDVPQEDAAEFPGLE